MNKIKTHTHKIKPIESQGPWDKSRKSNISGIGVSEEGDGETNIFKEIMAYNPGLDPKQGVIFFFICHKGH